MNDQGNAVFGKDIFIESMEVYVSVHFLQCFAIVPGRRPDETVICPLIPTVEQMSPELVFQVSERFDARHDISDGDALAKNLKQTVAERFKTD